jgi:hypothetical protein
VSAKKSDKIVLINTGRSGVVYDEAGHSVGGGERVSVGEIDAVGKAAVDAGQLRCDDGASQAD